MKASELINFSIVDGTSGKDYYAEVGQSSTVKFSVCSVDKDNSTITQLHAPIKCREFLSDWSICHATGIETSIYGFQHTPSKEDMNPCDVLLVHGSDKELQNIVTRSKGTKFSEYIYSTTFKGEIILVLSAPNKVMYSPLGIMLYTCLFRAMCYKNVLSLIGGEGGRMYLPAEGNEHDILRNTLSAISVTLLTKLVFDSTYTKFLYVPQKEDFGKLSSLPSYAHSQTGPAALSFYLKANKKKRDQLTDIKSSPELLVKQRLLLQEAMKAYAEGE